MAAHKGHAKAGGRKKGTPNKRTAAMVEAVEQTCERHGVNPIEGMCMLSKSTDDDSIRFQCYKELAGYMYAKKRQPIEVTGLDGAALDVNNSSTDAFVQEFRQAIEVFGERASAQSTKQK